MLDGGGEEGELADVVGAVEGATDDVDVSAVVSEGSDDAEEAADEEFGSREGDVLVVDLIGEGLESAGEEFVEAEELDFLCAFSGTGDLAEVVHLPLGRSLAEVFSVAEEGVVGLSEEGREDAEGQEEDEPRGCPGECRGEDEGGDDLLEEAPHLLDHGETVRGLDARSFEAVVEDRIFVGGEVEAGGLLHDAYADVLGVAIGEEGVRVVDGAGEEAKDDVEDDFRDDEGPEVVGEGVSAEGPGDVVDDVGGHFGDSEGQDGDDEAKTYAPGDDRPTGLPQDAQDWGHVAQSADAFTPRTFGFPSVIAHRPTLKVTD